MDVQEMIQQWKQPSARREETVEDHPSGGIVLKHAGSLGRRSDLLTARVGCPITVIPTTMSWHRVVGADAAA